jgi:type IV secretion system protein VirB2
MAASVISKNQVSLNFPRIWTFSRITAVVSFPRYKFLRRWGMEGIVSNRRPTVRAVALAAALLLPQFALAQASPFLTGANSLQTNILAWLTPVAIILIMVLGGMAMANRISWGWAIGAVIGIAIAFGAPQIVTWVRGMFGV